MQVEAARKRQNLVAVGINCIQPGFVTELFKGVEKEVQDFNIPLVVYPNSGEVYTVTFDTFLKFMQIDNFFQICLRLKKVGMGRMIVSLWKNILQNG